MGRDKCYVGLMSNILIMQLGSLVKLVGIVISAIAAGGLYYVANADLYFPKVIAPVTQMLCVLLSISSVLLQYQHENCRIKKVANRLWAYVLIILALFAAYSLTEYKVHPWCLLWILSAVSILRSHIRVEDLNKIEQEIEFQQLGRAGIRHSFDLPIVQTADNSIPMRVNECKVPCRHIIMNTFFFINITLICLLALNTHLMANYTTNFPILGRRITFKAPGKHYKVSFHYYCTDLPWSNHPTLVLEHGGGGNLAGFIPLLRQLQKKGVKGCVYDRLGYGRSSKAIPGLKLQEWSQMTDTLLSHILRTDQRIIYGGWSAGVQLSIAYNFYHPQRVDGLIFMDGYPGYLLLQAISTNASKIRNPHTMIIADVFRYLEPFGLDLLFGKNQITNLTLNDYYKAYYRTGYLWDTQVNDLKYSNTTAELSQLGRRTGAKQPYPDAKLYLNWPDIEVPLLIMPAKATVAGEQYRIQSQKYMEKCVNSVKMLKVMEGDHGFVLLQAEKIAQLIMEFIQQLP